MSPISNIFLGNNFYEESKAFHVYISINRCQSQPSGDLSQAQLKILIESYSVGCFFKSAGLLNILSLYISIKTVREPRALSTGDLY